MVALRAAHWVQRPRAHDIPAAPSTLLRQAQLPNRIRGGCCPSPPRHWTLPECPASRRLLRTKLQLPANVTTASPPSPAPPADACYCRTAKVGFPVSSAQSSNQAMRPHTLNSQPQPLPPTPNLLKPLLNCARDPRGGVHTGGPWSGPGHLSGEDFPNVAWSKEGTNPTLAFVSALPES